LEAHRFIRPSPVAGVIYIDSEAAGFFVSDDELKSLVSMTEQFLEGLKTQDSSFDRIRNVELTGLGIEVPPAEPLPSNVQDVLELVDSVAPPKGSQAFQLNFEVS
jgi:hypothetical protein